MIPYGRQTLGSEEHAAVAGVLDSDWLTQGPKVTEFEGALARQCGASHCVATSSGTAALHAICAALGVTSGDWVWTSPISFVASANCARYCGAKIDFVDIDSESRTLSPQALAVRLADARKKGQIPKLIIPVHFAGNVCDMALIYEIAQEYGVKVVEDACHALGGTYQEKPIGSCCYSDAAVFSFHPVKTITTGEGGAIVTNDQNLAERARQFCAHGITRAGARFDRSLQSDDRGAPWYYEQQLLGWNYRLTDIQAAIGIEQLKKLDGFVDKRRELFAVYNEKLTELPLKLPRARADCRISWHLYVVELQQAARRREIFNRLKESGIGVNVHYIPIHLQPDYRALGFSPGDFPASEAYYLAAMTLPLFPSLTSSEQNYVISVLHEVLA